MHQLPVEREIEQVEDYRAGELQGTYLLQVQRDRPLLFRPVPPCGLRPEPLPSWRHDLDRDPLGEAGYRHPTQRASQHRLSLRLERLQAGVVHVRYKGDSGLVRVLPGMAHHKVSIGILLDGKPQPL